MVSQFTAVAHPDPLVSALIVAAASVVAAARCEAATHALARDWPADVATDPLLRPELRALAVALADLRAAP